MLGAIHVQGSTDVLLGTPRGRAITRAFKYLRGVCGGDVMEFNDHHCLGCNDALTALHIAADLAAAHGD